MMERLLCLSLCFCLLLSGSGIEAHRLKTVETSIRWNPRTELLEVVHRTYAHDVEHTLGTAMRADGGLESIGAQAKVALMLSKEFQLWDERGKELPLELVGAELEGEFFYIYQEAALEAIPDPLRVRDDLLRSFWPDMMNYLNVHYPEGVTSLAFSGDDGAKLASSAE